MSSILSKLINLAGNITGTLAVGNGGSGSATFTTHGVLLGNGTSAFGVTAAGTNGQLLVGATSADPAWGNSVSAATTFTGGVVLGGGGTNLNFYQETTATVTFNTGAFTSQVVTAVIRRIGSIVTVTLPQVNATTNTTSNTMQTTATPFSAFPPVDTNGIYTQLTSLVNGVETAGYLSVSHTGGVSIVFKNDNSNVTSGTVNTGYRTATITYAM